MRVLLATLTDQLLEKLSVLNPELEYCAVVVDEVEPAKKILERTGLSKDLLFPMTELKACAEGFSYDYALCVQKHFYDKTIISELQKYDVPKDKIMSFAYLPSAINFQVEKALRYYQEHSQEIQTFATGISHAAHGLDVTQFKRKTFNLAKPSQDLYYDFKIAKRLISCGGHNTLRYALIGLVPYSFHYSISRFFRYRCLFLPYFIALNDLHDFHIPVDIYRKFFREEWLVKKWSLQQFTVNDPYNVKSSKAMDQQAVNGTVGINSWTWQGAYRPEICDENVKILDDYLTLCEENNIRPVMFMVPVSKKNIVNFNRKMLSEFYVIVEKACCKHSNAVFVDGWKWDGLTYTDFVDHEHLNTYGAAKFSTFLNSVIEQLDVQGG